MNGLVVDGKKFNVSIMKINREVEVLDKFAERSINGILTRKIIGVFTKFSINIDRFSSPDYDSLYNYITRPIEFFTINLPMKGTIVPVEGYISSISDNIKKIEKNGNILWDGLQFNFTPKKPD